MQREGGRRLGERLLPSAGKMPGRPCSLLHYARAPAGLLHGAGHGDEGRAPESEGQHDAVADAAGSLPPDAGVGDGGGARAGTRNELRPDGGVHGILGHEGEGEGGEEVGDAGHGDLLNPGVSQV